MVETGLIEGQFAAIKRSLKIGLELQRDFPEIAEDYRKGMFISRINSKYNLSSAYGGLKRNTLMSAIRYALRGHRGGFETDSYDGLIELGELERLSCEHKVVGGKRAGKQSHELRLGIHGRTSEQHAEDGRKGREGAKRGGRKSYELKLGVHGRTPEQMSEDGRKAAISRGRVPWESEEMEFAYRFSSLLRTGGSINYQLVAQRLNESYHNGRQVRTVSAVKNSLFKFRKQKNKTKP